MEKVPQHSTMPPKNNPKNTCMWENLQTEEETFKTRRERFNTPKFKNVTASKEGSQQRHEASTLAMGVWRVEKLLSNNTCSDDQTKKGPGKCS